MFSFDLDDQPRRTHTLPAVSIRPEILATCKRRPVIFSDGQLDHRGMVIRIGCDLEADLVALVVAHDVRSGRDVDASLKAREKLTLTGMANTAHRLELIDSAERDDIHRLAELRNRYAHDKHRLQLDEDVAMSSLIEETALYADTSELRTFAAQQVLMAITLEMRVRLGELLEKVRGPVT